MSPRRPQSTRNATRRQFLATGAAASAAVGLGTFAAPAIVRGRNINGKLGIACIGVGGRGGHNMEQVSSENIVAVCDVAGPRLTVAETRAKLDTQRPGSPDLTSAVVGRPLVYQYGGSAGVTHDFSRLQMTLRGSVDRYDYEDAQLNTGGILSQVQSTAT